MGDGGVQSAQASFLPHFKAFLVFKKKSFKFYIVSVDSLLNLFQNCVNAQQMEFFHIQVKR